MDQPTSPLVALLFVGVLIGYVILTIAMIVVVSDNQKLSGRQKWGYALGMLFALPLFLPLYLILAPARTGESEADFFARMRGDNATDEGSAS